ncbi:hypothetical protein [Bartonella gliris]|uniref:hypothetical protein n=1 Tax=Bartonella gliris TaxID=3004109 RepID=UPI00295EF1D3|nr:hypothetical protein [Bartonella gliris]
MASHYTRLGNLDNARLTFNIILAEKSIIDVCRDNMKVMHNEGDAQALRKNASQSD